MFMVLAATLLCGTATLTGCKKDNPDNNKWGAETLTFKVKNTSDVLMRKVEGGDYSMEAKIGRASCRERV